MKRLLKARHVFDGRKVLGAAGVLVENDRIKAITAYDAQINDAETIDFGDRLLMPGFIDAHTHFFSGAVSASKYVCTEIRNAASQEECVRIMQAYREEHPEIEVLRGEGWFIGNWRNRELPDKRLLDRAFPDIPVYMKCTDAHSYWLNSAALAQCGIDGKTKPESGYVGRFEDGELNGILVEPDAYEPADRIFYRFSEEEQREIYQNFFQLTASYGIVGISEMFAEEYTPEIKKKYELMRELDIQGRVKARFYIYTRLFDHTDFTTAKRWQQEFDSPHVRIAGVKGFVDGVAETYTGMMLEPYSDRPDTCGLGVPLRPYEEMKASIQAANAAGLPVRLHCIGDGAIRMALDLYEAAGSLACNTIEHIESIHPDDIPRFRTLGVIPSMQPAHLVLDNNNKIIRVGKERIPYEWCLKSIYESTGTLAIGTDYPVVQINPFKTIYAAVTRCGYDGRPTGSNPEEKLTMLQTLTAYTANAAGAYNDEAQCGTLEAGKYADLIVIDKDLFTISEKEILNCRVVFTMLDGTIIYKGGYDDEM